MGNLTVLLVQHYVIRLRNKITYQYAFFGKFCVPTDVPIYWVKNIPLLYLCLFPILTVLIFDKYQENTLRVQRSMASCIPPKCNVRAKNCSIYGVQLAYTVRKCHCNVHSKSTIQCIHYCSQFLVS